MYGRVLSFSVFIISVLALGCFVGRDDFSFGGRDVLVGEVDVSYTGFFLNSRKFYRG